MNLKWQMIALLSLLAAAAAHPARADSLLPQVGGEGGAQYHERCPEGQVLNGFELRAGDDIDAIRAVCVTPVSTTSSTAPPLSNGFGAGWHGGGGGGLQRVLCPPKTPVVVGVYLFADGRDTVSLDQIAIFCGEISPYWTSNSNYPSNLFFAPIQKDLCPPDWFSSCVIGRGPLVYDPLYCPDRMIAIGMYGRSGNLVDAMGLICGPAPIFTASTPAMGHTEPALTPLQKAVRGTKLEKNVRSPATRIGTATSLNPQPLPPGKNPDIKVSPQAASAIDRNAIIIIGGKPQVKQQASTPKTVYQILQNKDDGSD